MMQTLQVSLLNSQASSQNNNNASQDIKQPVSDSSPINSSFSYSTVRSMKDLLNPSSSNTDYSNGVSLQKEFPQMIHEHTSSGRLIHKDLTPAKENINSFSSGITLPSLSNDNHKPPSSHSETSSRLPSNNTNLESPQTIFPSPSLPSIVNEIHNAGSLNVSQLINVSPQYYQLMMQNGYSLPAPPLPSSTYPLPSIGMVVPPSTTASPPSPNSASSTQLPAVKELLPSSAPLVQPSYQGSYPVPWYGYPAAPNYMNPRQPVPYYGSVQEAIPVMVEATVEEDLRKRKMPSPSTAKKTDNSPTMGTQSSNCQHHPKPDNDPKTVPFQLKFKSKKERPKNGAFEMQWMEHFTTLKQFYQQFGHTNVTRSTPGHKNLGNWVAEQRRKMRRGKLTKEQYELMNSIAFEWDRSYFFKPSVFTNSDEEDNGFEEKKFKFDS